MLPCVIRIYVLSGITKSPLVFSTTERDSPRDQLVVTLFLLTVFGLLLGAGIKNRMVKAGFDTGLPWNTGRRWWEVGFICRISVFLVFTCPYLLRHGLPNGNPIILG